MADKRGTESPKERPLIQGQVTPQILDIAYKDLQLVSADGLHIDLHWRLSRKTQLIDARFEDLYDQAKVVELDGAQVPILSNPTAFVYLIYHDAAHAWFRLKWLADFDRIVPKLSEDDAQEILICARDAGLEHCLRASFQLLTDVYSTQLSPTFSQMVKGSGGSFFYHRMSQSLISGRKVGRARLANLTQVARHQVYLATLNREPGFLWNALVSYCVATNIKTLRLSHRWVFVYVLLAPFLMLTRFLSRGLVHALAAIRL